MSKDVIAALESELARAIADEEFEIAAALRDRIAAMKAGRPTGSMLQRLRPGELGQSVDSFACKPPKDWVKPKRPDPMTKVHKPASRRSD